MARTWADTIRNVLRDGAPYSQLQLAPYLKYPNRDILTGYLRCLTEMDEESGREVYVARKTVGARNFIYFLAKIEQTRGKKSKRK